jgi:hypothetical protein
MGHRLGLSNIFKLSGNFKILDKVDTSFSMEIYLCSVLTEFSRGEVTQNLGTKFTEMSIAKY